MKIVLIPFLFSSLFSAIISELVGIIDIFRHGARSPVTVNRFGKDIIDQKWIGKAELTNIGIRQLYLAGQELRRKYKENLQLNGGIKVINIYSTNTNRTILSAYSKIMGLFNDSNIVFPVKIIDLPVESPDLNPCNSNEKEVLSNRTLAEINRYMKRFEKTIYPFIKYKINIVKQPSNKRMLPFTPSTKEKKFPPKLLYHIAEAIYCAQTDKRNLSYLELTKENITFFEEFRHFFLFNGKRNRNESLDLIIPYLNLVDNKIEELLNKERGIKYIGLSVHDTTLVNLFIFFEIIDLIPKENHRFPFASQLIIEVYSNRSLNFIYNDQKIFSIDFSLFRELKEKITIENKDSTFCFSSLQGIFVFKDSANFMLYFIIFDFLLLLVFLLIFFFYKGEKETSETKKLIRNRTDQRSQEIKLIRTNTNNSGK